MAPNGAMAQLYGQGTYYSNYYVKNSAADSFPGVIGPTTGAQGPCRVGVGTIASCIACWWFARADSM